MDDSLASSGPSVKACLSAQVSRTSCHARIRSLPSNLPQRTPIRPVSPRRRTTIACERCRLLKARCDASWPRCSNCCKVDADCKKSYYTSGSAKQYIESLEQRCMDLEQCLDALVTRSADNPMTPADREAIAKDPATMPCLPVITETGKQSEFCVTPLLLPHIPLPEATPSTWTWDGSMMTDLFPMYSPASLQPDTKPQTSLDVQSGSHSSLELLSDLDLTGMRDTI